MRTRQQAGRVSLVAAFIAIAICLVATFVWLNLEPHEPASALGDSQSGAHASLPLPDVASPSALEAETSGDDVDRASVVTAPRPRGTFGPAIPRKGRTASLAIDVTARGLATSATVTFIAGPERGRSLELYEAPVALTDLNPGLSVVEIATPTGERIRRDVLLRHRRRAELSIDFGVHGVVAGTVRGPNGAPLSGAEITLDGAITQTASDGTYQLTRRVSGLPVVHVRLDGYATHRQRMAESRSGEITADITLRPASRLTIHAPSGVAAGPLALILTSSGDPFTVTAGRPEPTYPWSSLEPLTLAPGATLALDDLPTCQIDVLALDARGAQATGTAWCRPDEPTEIHLTLVPCSTRTIHVERSGEPVAGARVLLTCDNLASARARAFGKAGDRRPLPIVPATHQSVTTNALGDAIVGVPASVREAWYVKVVSDDVTVVRALDDASDVLTIELDRPLAD